MPDKNVFDRRDVPSGAIVMREGDPGNCAYLIQAGRVVVFNENNGKPVELARLGVGEIFGEMSLTTDQPRSATVKAVEETTLIVITREVLDRKLDRSDSTIQAIMMMLIKRMAASNDVLVGRKGSLSGLKSAALAVYNNVAMGLTVEEKTVFEQEVRSKLDDFLAAATRFSSRFSKM